MEAPKVFISHATEDNLFVEQLVNRLKEYHLDIWVDFESIHHGTLTGEVSKAIHEAQIGIFVLSTVSCQKKWVEREYSAFFSKPAPNVTLPILLGIEKGKLPVRFTIVGGDLYLQNAYSDTLQPDLITKLRKAIQESDQVSKEASYYFHDIEHLDLILARREPSTYEKEMVKFLVQREEAYREYLFKNLQHPQWLPWLKRMDVLRFPEYQNLTEYRQYLTQRKRDPHSSMIIYLKRVAAQLSAFQPSEWEGEFWDLFREDHLLGEFRWKYEYFPSILAQADQPLIPTWLIKQAATWHNPDQLNAQVITHWLPKLIDQPLEEERLEAVESLLKACLRLSHQEERFRLGVDSAFTLRYLHGEGDMRKIGAFCSEAFIHFISDQLKKVCLAQRPQAQIKLPEINEKAFGIQVSLSENVEVEVYSLESDDPEPLYSFSIAASDSLEELTENLAKALERRNLFEIATKNAINLKDSLRRLFPDPYSQFFQESSLRKLGPNQWHDHEGKYAPLILLLELMRGVMPERPELAETMLSEWLHPHQSWPIFTRVALELVNEHWTAMRVLFWRWLSQIDREEPFENYLIKAELAYLIQDRWGDFTKDEKQSWLSVVETNNLSSPRKLDWLTPGKDDLLVKASYEALKAESGGYEGDLMPEGFRSTITGGYRAPVSHEELLAMEPAAVADYLNNFEPSDDFLGPKPEGLAEQLKIAIQGKPEWLTGDLKNFMQVPYLYVRAMIDGITEATKNRQVVPLESYLHFFLDYMNQEDFWDDAFMAPKQDRGQGHQYFLQWYLPFIEAIADSKDIVLKNWTQITFSLAQISDRLPSNPEPTVRGEHVGAVDRAINDLGGRMLMVVVKLAILKAKTDNPNPQEGDELFDPGLKAIWETQLSHRCEAALTMLGIQVNPLYYLHAAWVKVQLGAIGQEPESWWPCMQGYLYQWQGIYRNTYDLMQPFYLRFEREVLPELRADPSQAKRFHEAYVQHLGVAYLQGFESLGSDTPWGRLVEAQAPAEIRTLFFLAEKQQIPAIMADDDQDFPTQVNQRILDLWGHLYQAYQARTATLTEDDGRAIGFLGLLMDRLPSLEAPYLDWAIFSATRLPEKQYLADDYVKKLLALKNRLGEQDLRPAIAQIVEPVATSHFPDFPVKNVQEILAYLLESEDEQVQTTLRNICHQYALQGAKYAAIVEPVARQLD